MKLAASYQRREREYLGPLVDIVFLLLVFFMLAGHLRSADSLGVRPPQSTGKTGAAPAAMLVVLTVDGRLAVDGRAVGGDLLGTLLKHRVAVNPKITVDLKADAGVPTGALLRVLGVLREAGLQNVRLVTERIVAGEDNP